MIPEALERIRERLGTLTTRPIRIVAVTKGHDAATLRAVVQAGLVDIGENYAQELIAKVPRAGDLTGVTVHFLGRIQTNKIRALAPVVDRYDSVDRDAVVDALAMRCPRARILVQVSTTGEEGKGGVAPEGVPDLVARARDQGLMVEGLMTVGPTRGGPEAARAGFAQVRALADRVGLEVVSMGMSEDFEVAVAQGATEIRLGSILVGPRPQGRGAGAVA